MANGQSYSILASLLLHMYLNMYDTYPEPRSYHDPWLRGQWIADMVLAEHSRSQVPLLPTWKKKTSLN